LARWPRQVRFVPKAAVNNRTNKLLYSARGGPAIAHRPLCHRLSRWRA